MAMAVRHSRYLEASEKEEGSTGTDVDSDWKEEIEEKTLGLDGGQGTVPSVRRSGQRL